MSSGNEEAVTLPQLDLHGLTVDEALPQVDQYLYEAYNTEIPWVRLIHGKGTGTLRQAVREQLRTHTLVKSFRPGLPGEGGEGVTIVQLVDW